MSLLCTHIRCTPAAFGLKTLLPQLSTVDMLGPLHSSQQTCPPSQNWGHVHHLHPTAYCHRRRIRTCRPAQAAVRSQVASAGSWLGGRSDLGAYIDVGLHVEGASQGPLAGRTVAIKDLFDVAGHRTGFGHPLWQETHPPADLTAPAVQRLLDAGACVRGRTHMDELAYSLNGENVHYGTPSNPAAPCRIPGGSSSGSAVAVAAGHVDVGLGSDTGGSVRVPASYCGVFGMRPSHGRVPLQGARPLAPSFDTVGWFTRTWDLFETAAEVLLDPPSTPTTPTTTQILWPADAWQLAQPPTAAALLEALTGQPLITGQGVTHNEQSESERLTSLTSHLESLPGVFGSSRPVQTVTVGCGRGEGEAGAQLQEAAQQLESLGLRQLTDWLDVFRVCQAGEIWQEHGGWITQHKPDFGPGIKERFAMAAGITAQEWAEARSKRQAITAMLHHLLLPAPGEGCVGILVMPTAPGPAPLLNTPAASLDDWRKRLLSLTCIAGLAGLPQVTLPIASVEGLPVGLSLVGPPGYDEVLLQAARDLLQRQRPDLL